MKKSNKSYKLIMTIMFTLIIINLSGKSEIYASSFNGVVSSSTVVQGDNVTVTFTMTADDNIGVIALSMTYDDKILQYVSGGSSETSAGIVTFYNADGLGKNYTYTIKFKAVGVGSTTLKINEINVPINENGDDFTTSYSAGTVTVNPPVAASTNNYLSSLLVSAVFDNDQTSQMTLSPAFSKDGLSYNLSVGSDVKRLAISAKPEDGKAKVASWGTALDAGKNTTTIQVTAEDGSVRIYKIYTEKAHAEQPIEEPTEPPVVDENRKVNISDTAFIITDVTDETALPEGFEKTIVTYNGIEISAATDLANTLTLFYMMNEETNEYIFFIYNLSDNTFSPFLSYTITQRSYILLMVEDNFYYNNEAAINSKDLELTSLSIANGHVDAYKIRNTENIYIVRAMNWNGEVYYYYYNIDDGSMIPYFNSENSEKEVDELQEVIASEHDAFEKRINKRNIVIYLLGGIVVVMYPLTSVMFYFYNKKKRNSDLEQVINVYEPEYDVSPELAATQDAEEEFEETEQNYTEMYSNNTEEVSDELVPLVDDVPDESEITEEPMKEDEIDKAIEDIMENLIK